MGKEVFRIDPLTLADDEDRFDRKMAEFIANETMRMMSTAYGTRVDLGVRISRLPLVNDWVDIEVEVYWMPSALTGRLQDADGNDLLRARYKKI